MRAHKLSLAFLSKSQCYKGLRFYDLGHARFLAPPMVVLNFRAQNRQSLLV